MKLLLFSILFIFNANAKDKDLSKIKGGFNSEWSYVYLAVGNTTLKTSNLKKTGTLNSIGYKRTAQSLTYGGSFSRIYSKGIFKIERTLVTLGYAPEWKNRIKPFIELGSGRATFSDLKKNKNVSGYVNSLDFGFKIVRNLPFHVMTGMSLNFYNFDNKDLIDTATSQSMFVIFGFEF